MATAPFPSDMHVWISHSTTSTLSQQVDFFFDMYLRAFLGI